MTGVRAVRAGRAILLRPEAAAPFLLLRAALVAPVAEPAGTPAEATVITAEAAVTPCFPAVGRAAGTLVTEVTARPGAEAWPVTAAETAVTPVATGTAVEPAVATVSAGAAVKAALTVAAELTARPAAISSLAPVTATVGGTVAAVATGTPVKAAVAETTARPGTEPALPPVTVGRTISAGSTVIPALAVTAELTARTRTEAWPVTAAEPAVTTATAVGRATWPVAA